MNKAQWRQWAIKTYKQPGMSDEEALQLAREFKSKIGKVGGSVKVGTKGFGKNPELAALAGAKSRRVKRGTSIYKV